MIETENNIGIECKIIIEAEAVTSLLNKLLTSFHNKKVKNIVTIIVENLTASSEFENKVVSFIK